MFKFSVIIAATIAAAIGPASAQQPVQPKAELKAAAAASDSGQTAAPAGARAYIINLKNGDTVSSPFKVQFGLTSNMGVAPAGIDKENVGHHHLLIDTTLTAEEMTQPVASDEKHIHFGKGQTETTVTLPPGKHTLQLVLANWTHIPFNPPVQSEVITITVKGTAAAKPVAAAKPKAEPKAASKAAPKAESKADSKPAPKEAAKDVAKEAPVQVAQNVKKEEAAPKETSKETSKKETPKEASKDAKKDAPKEVAKDVKTEAPKEAAKKDGEAKEAAVTHRRHHHRRHYRHRRHHYYAQYMHT
jgi:hypothetical protein